MPRSAPYGLLVGLVSAACFGFSGPLARALIDAGLTPLQAVGQGAALGCAGR